MLGLDARTYLVASMLGRGGKYLLEAVSVLALGDAVRSMSEADLHAIIGAVALVAVAAYLLTRRWKPGRRAGVD